jgi:hypothetical protein
MALKIVTVKQTPEEMALEWLHTVDPKILACRGQGHAFPKIKDGKMSPRQNWVEQNQLTGQSQLVQLCRDGCGTERCVTTTGTGPRLDIELPAKFTYRRTKRGYSPPRGSARVSRRECFAETMRRRNEPSKDTNFVPELKFSSN